MSKTVGYERKASVELAAITTKADLTNYAEASETPVSRALFENDLVGYDENAELAVNSDQVKEAAGRLAMSQRYAEATVEGNRGTARKEEDIAAVQSLRGVNRRTAVAQINRDKSAEANAVLLAAKVGRVKLTTAQQTRLEEISAGRYISADRKQREATTGAASREARIFQRARYDELNEYRLERFKKAS